AVAARKEADEQARRAEQQSRLAVKTLTAMVFDFQRKLSHLPGARAVRQAWLEDALERLQEVGRGLGTSAQADRTTMVAHSEIGDIFLDSGSSEQRKARPGPKSAGKQRGWIEEAQWHYQQAHAIGKQLAEADPASATAQRDLSRSYNKLGDVSLKQENGRAARRYYQKGLDICKKLSEADPVSVQAQRDLAVSYNKLGDVSLELKDVPAARGHYRKGLDIFKKLGEANPASATAQRDLALSYNKLGDVSLKE